MQIIKFINLVLLGIGISNGFIINKFSKNSNKIYSKGILYDNKMFDSENNINLTDYTYDKMYTVISFKNNTIEKLLDDLDYFGFDYIYCDMKIYEKKELKKIFTKYVKKNKNFSYRTQPWIFENDRFIGGLFEIYSIIYKNI